MALKKQVAGGMSLLSDIPARLAARADVPQGRWCQTPSESLHEAKAMASRRCQTLSETKRETVTVTSSGLLAHAGVPQGSGVRHFRCCDCHLLKRVRAGAFRLRAPAFCVRARAPSRRAPAFCVRARAPSRRAPAFIYCFFCLVNKSWAAIGFSRLMAM
jgi:hypothetical protein